MSTYKLHNYFRSSASFRVRIAMNWKQLPYEYVPVHLVRNGGEQHSAIYKRLNPMGEVPCLEEDQEFFLSQSLAIFQYLDAQHPERPLFPPAAREKARVWQLCEILNSGIQPLQNLIVLQELEKRFAATPEDKEQWAQFWIGRGFQALEKFFADTAGTYSFGGEITAVDCCLFPQVITAQRFKVDLAHYPILQRVFEALEKVPAFEQAKPQHQPDFSP